MYADHPVGAQMIHIYGMPDIVRRAQRSGGEGDGGCEVIA